MDKDRKRAREAQRIRELEEKNHTGMNDAPGKSKKKTLVGTIIMVILAMCVMVGIVFASQNKNNSVGNNDTTSGKTSVTNEESQNSEVKVGDIVKFGTYDNSDIQWKVLDKEGDKALLITEDCLLGKEYNEECESVTWEDCTLRSWLNNDFYNDSFSETERNQIVETALVNQDTPEYGTEGGSDTEDKIFLLSIDEEEQYFSTDEERKATYADGSSAWWLRSPGYRDYFAAYVLFDGYVAKYGTYVDDVYVAVRPALWVNLNSDLF